MTAIGPIRVFMLANEVSLDLAPTSRLPFAAGAAGAAEGAEPPPLMLVAGTTREALGTLEAEVLEVFVDLLAVSRLGAASRVLARTALAPATSASPMSELAIPVMPVAPPADLEWARSRVADDV